MLDLPPPALPHLLYQDGPTAPFSMKLWPRQYKKSFTLSMSRAEILYPPDFMMSTLVRPSMRKIPPSTFEKLTCSMFHSFCFLPCWCLPSETIRLKWIPFWWPLVSPSTPLMWCLILCESLTREQDSFFLKPEHIWPFDQELSLLAVERRNLKMNLFVVCWLFWCSWSKTYNSGF